MYNKKLLLTVLKDLNKAKKPAKKKDIGYDPSGKGMLNKNHKGKPVRLATDTLYNPTPYRINAKSDNGIEQTLEPYDETNVNFPGANYVDEYPEMKKGGGFSRNLAATNRLFKKNKLFKKNSLFKPNNLFKKKNYKRKTYDPLSMYFQDGGDLDSVVDVTLLPEDGRSYYDPLIDEVYLNPFASEDEVNHELVHGWQNRTGGLRSDPLTPKMRPSAAASDEQAATYFNRKGDDVQYYMDNLQSIHPEMTGNIWTSDMSKFIPEEIQYNRAIEPLMYYDPNTMEGEAEWASQTHGAPPLQLNFKKKGGDINNKTYIPKLIEGGLKPCGPGKKWDSVLKKCVLAIEDRSVLNLLQREKYNMLGIGDKLPKSSYNPKFIKKNPQYKKDDYLTQNLKEVTITGKKRNPLLSEYRQLLEEFERIKNSPLIADQERAKELFGQIGGIELYNPGLALGTPRRESFEDNVNYVLGNPMSKASVSASSLGEGDEDEIDNFRHPQAGRYATEAIMDYFPEWLQYTGIPQISGFLGANALGIGHEASVFFNDDRPLLIRARESAEDIFNNAVGAGVGVLPIDPKNKTDLLLDLSYENKLPDGYGEPDVNGYFKKNAKDKGSFKYNNGGVTPENYIETELTPEQIEQYKKGGYIVEDISLPRLNKFAPGGTTDEPPGSKKKNYGDSKRILPRWMPERMVKAIQNTEVGISPLMSNEQAYPIGMKKTFTDMAATGEMSGEDIGPMGISNPAYGINFTTGLTRDVSKPKGSGWALKGYLGRSYDPSLGQAAGAAIEKIGQDTHDARWDEYYENLADYNAGTMAPSVLNHGWTPESAKPKYDGKLMRGLGRAIQKSPLIGGLSAHYRYDKFKQPHGYKAAGEGEIKLDWDPSNNIGLGLKGGLEFYGGNKYHSKNYRPGSYKWNVSPSVTAGMGTRPNFGFNLNAGVEGLPKFMPKNFPGYFYGDVNYNQSLIGPGSLSANAGMKFPLNDLKQRRAKSRVQEKEKEDIIVPSNTRNTTFAEGGTLQQFAPGGAPCPRGQMRDASGKCVNYNWGSGNIQAADSYAGMYGGYDSSGVKNLKQVSTTAKKGKKFSDYILRGGKSRADVARNIGKNAGQYFGMSGEALEPVNYTKAGLDKFTTDVKNAKKNFEADEKNYQNYLKSKEKASKGKMDTSKYARQYDEKGWAKYDQNTKEGRGPDAQYSAKEARQNWGRSEDWQDFIDLTKGATAGIVSLATAGAMGGAGAAILENPYVQAGLTAYGLYDATTNTLPEAYKDLKEGNYWEAAGNTALGALDLVPGIGLAAKGAKLLGKGAKLASKSVGKGLGNLDSFVKTGDDVNLIDTEAQTLKDRILNQVKADNPAFRNVGTAENPSYIANTRGRSMNYDQTVDMLGQMTEKMPVLEEAGFPMYLHGSTSASLPGIIKSGGIEPLGELLSRGEVPFTGELATGVKGINQGNTSTAFVRSPNSALNYALNQSGKGKVNIEDDLNKWFTTKRETYEPGAYGAEPEFYDDLYNKRLTQWQNLSEQEKALLNENFPVMYGINPKTAETATGANRFTMPRSDIADEMGISGKISMDEIPSIFVPKEHVDVVQKLVGDQNKVLPMNQFIKNQKPWEQQKFKDRWEKLGYTLDYKSKNTGTNTNTGLTDADIAAARAEEEAWITSPEYLKRRMKNTGESVKQVKDDVARILKRADTATYNVNANLKGTEGAMSSNIFMNPKVAVSSQTSNPKMVLGHENIHLYSPASESKLFGKNLHKGWGRPDIADLPASERGVYANYPTIGDAPDSVMYPDVADYNYNMLGYEQQARHLGVMRDIAKKNNVDLNAGQKLTEAQVRSHIDDYVKTRDNVDYDYDSIWGAEILKEREKLANQLGKTLDELKATDPAKHKEILNLSKDNAAKTITNVLNKAWVAIPTAGAVGTATMLANPFEGSNGLQQQRRGGAQDLQRFITGGNTNYQLGDEVDEDIMEYLKALGYTFEEI